MGYGSLIWQLARNDMNNWSPDSFAVVESLEEVRRVHGDDFISVYYVASLWDWDSPDVIFFKDEAHAWNWISIILRGEYSAADVTLYNSRGVKLGEANNHWDALTHKEYGEATRGGTIPSIAEFLKTRPVAPIGWGRVPERTEVNKL